MFVVTVDQRGSRRAGDLVAEAVRAIGRRRPRPLRGFERTAGDEMQGVLDDPVDLVDLVLWLVRHGSWHVGVGAGPVDQPLPRSPRSGSGPAFVLAREAVGAARRRPQHLAVRGADPAAAAEAEAVLTLLAAVVERRTPAAWEAADLVAAGRTQAQAAERLGVTPQAVGQRLAAGLWRQEQEARPVAARLLAGAAG